MALQSDHEFAPTEIARVVFPTAFRGYDQDAVRRYLSRLAAALEHQQTFEDLGDLEVRTPTHDRVDELETEIVALQEEIRELETELVQRSVDQADEGSRRSSESSAASVEFDEARAIELLGQETARVLESARSAAADILKRAENQAATLKSEAKKELAEARRQAKKLLADKRAEAEAAIDELTEEAERSANQITNEAEEHRSAVLDESSKILAEAESKAEAEQIGAQSRARQIVADAEALRHQVVAELVADRRTARTDLDRMVEARDRLALSLAVARTELDGMSEQLSAASGGSGGEDDDEPSGVDDDEVARLIDRLETDRAAAGPDLDTETNAGAGRAEAGSAATDRATSERSRIDADDEVGSVRGGSQRKARSSRRPQSTIDEPTVEMPAVSVDDASDSDLDEFQVVQRRSNGVFDGDDDDLIDLGDPAPSAISDQEPVDDDREIDVDVIGSDDDLNVAPADGVPLSLVEGFSTIVLPDEKAEGANGATNGGGHGAAGPDAAGEPAPVATLVDEPSDPALVITTVAARLDGRTSSRTKGDLLIDGPFTDRLPDWFGARDVAVTRSEANLRRQLRRALNDDQSEVLDRLRSGRGAIRVDELQPAAKQVEQFLAPLRRGLTDVTRAGARAGGADDADPASLDNLIDQLAGYVVDRVRTPTMRTIEEADHDDREKILEPIRAVYRDFRNIGLPEVAADALNEAFAIGFYDSIEEGSPVIWAIDPRTDPDPVCEVNRDRTDLVKGERFPSGHLRPLSLPGCRCLVIGID